RIALDADTDWKGRKPPLTFWLKLRWMRRCVPLEPKYPTMIPSVGLMARWMLKFQDWTKGLSKSGSTVKGDRELGPATENALAKVTKGVVLVGVKVSGVLKGGLRVRPVTRLVTG